MTRRVFRYGLMAAACAAATWMSTSHVAAKRGWWCCSQHRVACRDADAEAADGHSRPQRTMGRGGGGGGNTVQRFDAKGNYHNLRNDRKGSPSTRSVIRVSVSASLRTCRSTNRNTGRRSTTSTSTAMPRTPTSAASRPASRGWDRRRKSWRRPQRSCSSTTRRTRGA
jgi:hypothetical protein